MLQQNSMKALQPHLPVFCVLGAGHGGLAMAGHLALMGFEVRLYTRNPERLEPIQRQGGIEVKGKVTGFGAIPIATTDIKVAIDGADVLMVVVPAYGHEFIAQVCAHQLSDGQLIVLNPGRTGGTLEFAQILRKKEVETEVFLAETQTLIYASRVTAPGQVTIFGMKNSVPLATLPAYWIPDVLKVVRSAFPQFVPGGNVLNTSFDNIGAVFHPALTVLNAAWIEETHGDFEYYLNGVSPSVSLILEAIDAERVAVAAALGIRAHTAREWLYLAYDAAGRSLYEAIHANTGYSGIKSPEEIHHRYITEDVPMSLVPIASIGKMLGIETPSINAIIHLASLLHQRDYWSEGRTVDKLGLDGLSVKEIRLLAVQGMLPMREEISMPASLPKW
jgi:opine dehydrogenase